MCCSVGKVNNREGTHSSCIVAQLMYQPHKKRTKCQAHEDEHKEESMGETDEDGSEEEVKLLLKHHWPTQSGMAGLYGNLPV